MNPLPSQLRTRLERTVIEAREAAETGARIALQELGVHHHEPYGHMSPEQRKLRNHLRARARQLGDKQDRAGKLRIDHLVRECGYEHWHRMLFARFLAENGLLFDPKHEVIISLDDAKELGEREGMDQWEYAGRCAQGALPQIFRPDDPLLQVNFANEHKLKLESLLDGLEPAVFTASDALGWVYQFWQSRRKDEVHASGKKIGADELPAVTQLFTEPYMVQFLIHNTLGAWYAGKALAEKPDLAANAETEQQLREAVAVPGVSWDYLRFVKVDAASSRVQEKQEPPAVNEDDTCNEAKRLDANLGSQYPAPGNGNRLDRACSDLPDRLHEEAHVGKPHVGKRLEAACTLELPVRYFDRTDEIENLSGNLPHWRQEGVTYFLTFRTADSMPQAKLKQWLEEREKWMREHPEPHSDQDKRDFYERFPKRLQYWLDQGYGACLLRDPRHKGVVEQALRHFDGDRYRLDEFAVACNHVHVLVTPIADNTLSAILPSWKSYTATAINEAAGRDGAFWQKESFDHIVRGPAQLERIREYISAHKKVDAASSRVLQDPQSQAPYCSRLETNRVARNISCARREGGGSKRLEAACTLKRWRPAAGVFEGWPTRAAELKVLDPCCGSGHFLVGVLQHLVPLRMAEENLSAKDAVDAVIRDNLHGLEIDERCTQIAAFAVGMAAWTYPGASGFRPLPDIRIACSGIAPNAKKEEWQAIARLAADAIAKDADNSFLPDPSKETMWHVQLKNGMEALYELFQQAPVLGSLIDPRKVGYDEVGGYSHSVADFEQLGGLLHDALSAEQRGIGDDAREMSVAAKGVADAVKLLAGRYHLVITNVPYLARGKQDRELREYIETHHGAAKQDLATAFIERTLGLCTKGGSSGLVTPQNWLFLGSYKKLREKLLKEEEWNVVNRLGTKGFQTPMWDFNVQLGVLTRSLPAQDHLLAGIDVSDARDAEAKAVALRGKVGVKMVEQKGQLGSPDCKVVLSERSEGELLGETAVGLSGILNGDSSRFQGLFWEVSDVKDSGWEFQQSTVPQTSHYSGRSKIILWEDGNGALRSLACELRERLHDADKRGNEAWGHPGVAVSQMNTLPVTLYTGDLFDSNVAILSPTKEQDLLALWAFCRSKHFNAEVRKIDQKVNVTNATLTMVPFDECAWLSTAASLYPNGLPAPYTDDPTQWLFHGHPCGSVIWSDTSKRLEIAPDRRDSTVLQTAIPRLLGYRWPAELDPDMRLSDESRQLVARCEPLLQFADKDGIVCIPSVRGEETCADRLRALLAKAYGDEWSPALEHELVVATGGKARDLDDWLRNEFFEQHCKLFQHRPFVWHIWDGRKRDGFHALVNYHNLAAGDGQGRKLLENLTYSYLGDWIARQKEGVASGEGGSEDRLIAALELRKRLIAILEGEPPYDIFVRWKPLEQQAIGWNPDINDGVRLNIRPFMVSDIPGGKKGAGVLRWTPNIEWKKDRGTEPKRPKERHPWFWDGDTFTGARVNERHLTNEQKQKAGEKRPKHEQHRSVPRGKVDQ